MRSSRLLAIGCAAGLSALSNLTLAADVVIGVPNWPSVQATAHILKAALEDRLDIEVTLEDGTNASVYRAMDAGAVHVHPEVWLPNHDNYTDQYVKAKQSITLNENVVEGRQGMCVTQSTAKRTGIVNLDDLKDPAMAKNFDTDGDGLGEVWIGAKGWASTTIERIRARSYGYDKTMTLRELDEADAMVGIEETVAQDKNTILFCYTPHHMFDQLDLVMLNEDPYDNTKWAIVQPSATPGWLEKSYADAAYKPAEIHIGISTSLEQDQPDAAAMLSKIALDTTMVSEMTHAIVVEGQNPEEYAMQWVKDNADIVKSWATE